MTRLLGCSLALMAVASNAHAVDHLFADPFAKPLEATLTIDLRQLLRSKSDDEPIAGQFHLDDRTFAVKVSQRGKSRLEHCSFPPLWLNFDHSKLDDTILVGQNKIKVVTHCSRTLETRGYLAAEMLVYRMLNVLTDKSFRVRAIKIDYEDPEEQKRETHHAFLIEHKKRLADRLGLELLEVPKVSRPTLDPTLTALAALFQYAVGNTDFSFTQGPANDECCHNVVPMRLPDGSIAPFVYDFDVTGLVNPPYAEPSPSLRIRAVTQRKFRGFCPHNAAILDVLPLFKETEHAILEMIADFDDIPDLRSRAGTYMQQFYSTIKSEKKLQSRILAKCRKV